MIYPPVTELVKKTGSRYSLVVETAKRARQLVDGSLPLSNVDTNKEVTMAVNEIYEGKIGVIRPDMECDNIEAKISAIKAFSNSYAIDHISDAADSSADDTVILDNEEEIDIDGSYAKEPADDDVF